LGNPVEICGAVDAQVRALGEILAQQPIGVFIDAALPGRVRVAEVDLDAVAIFTVFQSCISMP
jgi:hypothetical protein